MEICYRLFGLAHQFAKAVFVKSRLSVGKILPNRIRQGCQKETSIALWMNFVDSSKINYGDFVGTHYAGYIAESKEWCHPSWIWTNATVVRLYCENGEVEKAIELGKRLADYQLDCGGWIVRNDYDAKGAIPMLAPNDSAYVANNAFISLYNVTKELRYFNIARHCADWIIETARPDGLVYTGYNMRDKKWAKNNIIVDIGFTGGLFSKLVDLTGDEKYRYFLERFVMRYIELFYISEKNGFCTSIGSNDHRQGGMFARGQAWALEGLIPAYHILKSDFIKEIIEATIGNLIKQQCKNGGWPYNLTRKLMGEDCKAVSVIAKDMMDWYAVTKNERIKESADKALEWCRKHTAIEGEAKGGIFSYCVEGAIVKDIYTSCAFVYASAYAIELEKQLKS